MSLGLKKAGFNVKYKVDANEACCLTLRRNFPKKKVYQKLLSTFLKDLKEGRLKKVDTKRIALVHGSPPCQAWCLASKCSLQLNANAGTSVTHLHLSV